MNIKYLNIKFIWSDSEKTLPEKKSSNFWKFILYYFICGDINLDDERKIAMLCVYVNPEKYLPAVTKKRHSHLSLQIFSISVVALEKLKFIANYIQNSLKSPYNMKNYYRWNWLPGNSWNILLMKNYSKWNWLPENFVEDTSKAILLNKTSFYLMNDILCLMMY